MDLLPMKKAKADNQKTWSEVFSSAIDIKYSLRNSMNSCTK